MPKLSRDREYLHGWIHVVSGRIFFVACVSSNVYGPQDGIADSFNFLKPSEARP